MPNKKRRVLGFVIVPLLIAAIGGAMLWAVFNRNLIVDQVAVWSYTPSSDVSEIHSNIDLTDWGTFYFYATHPEVNDAKTFNQYCPRQEVGNPILGCYVNDRIYIYDINNNQLDGIKEVTAAHEMLHAVWERMSTEDQQRIGSLLREKYNSLDDKDLKTRMDYYQRTEPGQFENELHSILGTEVSNLGDELEQYYEKFFIDRSLIVEFNQQYNSVFEKLTAQADALRVELEQLNSKIQTSTAQYEQDVQALQADINSFNSRAENGEFESQAAFYSERATLVARSNQLEADRKAINADIALYNEKYNAYKQVAQQIEALSDSLDSVEALEPVPNVN